jgi:hypothetical protein
MSPAECTEPMQTGVFYPQNELPTGDHTVRAYPFA